MDIGKPTHEHLVEPVEDPVPRAVPLPDPEPDVADPEQVPASPE